MGALSWATINTFKTRRGRVRQLRPPTRLLSFEDIVDQLLLNRPLRLDHHDARRWSLLVTSHRCPNPAHEPQRMLQRVLDREPSVTPEFTLGVGRILEHLGLRWQPTNTRISLWHAGDRLGQHVDPDFIVRCGELAYPAVSIVGAPAEKGPIYQFRRLHRRGEPLLEWETKRGDVIFWEGDAHAWATHGLEAVDLACTVNLTWGDQCRHGEPVRYVGRPMEDGDIFPDLLVRLGAKEGAPREGEAVFDGSGRTR